MDPTTIALFVVIGAVALFAFIMNIFVTSISKGTVTQLTNATTAVTLNKKAGVITTVALSTAADTSFEFTVNNSVVKADSIVLASVEYTGNGHPSVHVKSVAAGSFVVVVRNVNASAALNAAADIHFYVL